MDDGNKGRKELEMWGGKAEESDGERERASYYVK